jgi:hypothetical protein
MRRFPWRLRAFPSRKRRAGNPLHGYVMREIGLGLQAEADMEKALDHRVESDPARHARMPHVHIGFARQTRPIPIGCDGLGAGVIAVVSVGHASCQ